MLKISDVSSPEEWEFFANGNANCLFKYVGPNEDLVGKLLRLRVQKDLSGYISTKELHNFIESKCRRLFPKEMIQSEMVSVPGEFLSGLKSTVSLMHNEVHGFLIANVLHGGFKKYILSKNCALHVESRKDRDEIKSVIFELKPKWLYKNTRNYCRTCLLYQLKGFERHFCSLDFLKDETVQEGVLDLLSIIPDQVSAKLKKAKLCLHDILIDYLKDSDSIFRRLGALQEVQTNRDEIVNLRCEKDVLEALSMLMTLRDVGVFIQIFKSDAPRDKFIETTTDAFESKTFIYDLDLKSSSKFKHWVQTENQLKNIYDSYNPRWRLCSKQ